MSPETLEDIRTMAYEFDADFAPQAVSVVLRLVGYVEELRAEAQDYHEFLTGMYGDCLQYEDEVTQQHVRSTWARIERLLWEDD